MGTTLTGTRISDTYDSLLKATDNGIITSSAKQITDGVGNNTPLYISTSRIGIGVSPTTTFQVSGNSKIGGDLTVTGNLLVEGTTTTVDTDTLSVKDPLIIVGNDNNTSDLVDLGFYGLYDTSGSQDLYAGLYRSASTTKFHLFKDLQEEPTTTVNTSGTGYAVASLVANLEGNVIGGTISSTGATFSGNVVISNSGVPMLSIQNTTNNVQGIFYASNTQVVIGSNTSSTLKFLQDGGTALTIDTSKDATFVGDIILAGTVDGRDVATDGAKLDGIEAGADVTDATNVLAAGAVMTTGNQSISGVKTFSDQVTIPATPSASTDAASKGYVDTQIEENNELSEVLANGNTTGGTDIAITAGDKITNFTSTGIDDNATSTVLTIDNTNRALFSGDVSLQANLIGNTNATGDLTILGSLFVGDYGVNDDPDYLYADNNIVRIGYYSNAKQFEVNNSDFKVTATHKVGIGTNDPQTLLEVSNENSGLNPIIRLNNVDSSLSDGQNLGSIEFYNDHTNNTTGNIGMFYSSDGAIFKEMRFNFGSPYGDIFKINVNEINAIKRFTITGSGSTPRVTLANNAGEGAFTYSLRSQDNGTFGIFKQNSEILGINLDDEVFINLEDDGKFSIVSATDEAAYLDFSDGSGLKNFIRFDHDGDIFGYNSWGSHLFSLGEGVPSLTLTSAAATVHENLIVEGNATFGGSVTGGGADDATALFLKRSGGANVMAINTNANGSWTMFDYAAGAYTSGITQKSGNVGIGTDDPYTGGTAGRRVLDIAGTSQALLAFSVGGAAQSYFFQDGTDFKITNLAAAGGDIIVENNGAERMRIDSSGLVSIKNTGVPTLRLDNTDTSLAVQTLGSLEYYQNDPSGTGVGAVCKINAVNESSFQGEAALTFQTGSASSITERMRINSSGVLTVGGQTSTRLVTTLTENDKVDINSVDGTSTARNLTFSTGNTERMRITSGGSLLVGGQTSTVYTEKFSIENTTASQGMVINQTDNANTNDKIIFRNTNGVVGYIRTTGSATSYVTSSDYRLKENVVEMTGALDRVSQLKPSRFNFIGDTDKTVDGFLAHEVQEIVPEAITGEKDAMIDEEYEVSPDVYEDVVHPAEEAVYETVEHPAVEEELDDEGNVVVEAVEAYTEEVLVTEAKEEWTEKVLVTEKVMGTREVPDYQGIDQSKLVPLLVGAIQEQQQLINDLKNRIETLENN